MHIDQNEPTKRTDLVCDDLPPIEAQQLAGSYFIPFDVMNAPSDGCYCCFEGRQSAKIWFWSIHTHQAWSEFYSGLLLDVVDHEEILVLLLLFNVRRSQRWLGAHWLETDKWECTHQIGAIEAVLADAKNHGVTLKLFFGEFQQWDERMLRCLMGHSRW